MATAPMFRIDVDIHNLLMDSSRRPVKPAAASGRAFANCSLILPALTSETPIYTNR
jgi:hypothetical protein